MISLDEHNYSRASAQADAYSNDPKRNGIACPKCSAELFDSDPMTTLASCPPKKTVHCDSCSYVGYRVA